MRLGKRVGLHAQPQPARDYADAIERIQTWQVQEAELASARMRSILR